MRIIKQNLEVDIYQDKIWYIEWYKNNKLHREDGPAAMWPGRKSYYLNNKFYDEEYDKDSYWKEVHANY